MHSTVLKAVVKFAVALVALLAPLHADDVSGMMRKVIEHQKTRPWFFDMQAVMLRDMPYVYRYTATREKRDKKGRVVESRTWASDMIPISGYLYPGDNGSAGQKSVATQEKDYRRFANVPDSEKAKREDRWEKYRQERRKFWDEFLKAFTFDQVRRESRNGRPATVVRFAPKPGYHGPDVLDAKYFKLIRGQFWIDDEDLEIVRLDCEFIDDVKFGGGVFGKIYKGSRYSMELAKAFDGKWWPAHAVTEFSKRVLVSKSSDRLAVTFSDYRKFSATSEIKLEQPIERD